MGLRTLEARARDADGERRAGAGPQVRHRAYAERRRNPYQNISISPTGDELPPGRGSAKDGAQLYRTKGARAVTAREEPAARLPS